MKNGKKGIEIEMYTIHLYSVKSSNPNLPPYLGPHSTFKNQFSMSSSKFLSHRLLFYDFEMRSYLFISS
jgi:hypothetical protein